MGDQVEVSRLTVRPTLLAAAPGADAAARSATTVDAEVPAAAPSFKIVARAGVGPTMSAATACGVLAANAPDVEHPQRRGSTRWRCCWPSSRQDSAADAGAARAHLEAFVVLPVPRSSRKTAGVVGLGPHRAVGRPADRCSATSSPMTRTFRRPVRRSWASNCCPWTTCWPAPISHLRTYRNTETDWDRMRRWRRPSRASSSSTPMAAQDEAGTGRRDHRRPRAGGSV